LGRFWVQTGAGVGPDRANLVEPDDCDIAVAPSICRRQYLWVASQRRMLEPPGVPQTAHPETEVEAVTAMRIFAQRSVA
jgi:hypothetical protein